MDEPHASPTSERERNLVAASTIAGEAFVAGYKAALADLADKPDGAMLADWGAEVYARQDELALRAWERIR